MSGWKIEIGGGTRPKGGYLNLDCIDAPEVNHRCDLEDPHLRLPYPDESVTEVYSSHCLEHVRNLHPLLGELARVCAVGAKLEIWVPHWNSAMALAPGHVHTLPPQFWVNLCETFWQDWWRNHPRRPTLDRIEHIPSAGLAEAQKLFPKIDRQALMHFVPDTCHEIRVHMTMVKNELYGTEDG